METLTMTLKTVTPLFLGGASPNEQAELRPPSIKGALRFWYRAIDLQYNQRTDPAGRDSPTWEQRLFGSTDSGQAGFLLRGGNLRARDGRKGDNRWDRKMTAYLGFGPIIRDRKLKQSVTTRPFLESGTEFTLNLLFKRGVDDASRLAVERALWALCTLGGVGSRSRRGFGSLMVAACLGGSGKTPPWSFEDRAALVKAMKQFFGSVTAHKGLPSHTCWSDRARCVVGPETTDGGAALEWLGREMHAFRSFRGEKNFIRDHDLMRDYLQSGKTLVAPPLRAAFGLPHNYFFTKSLPNVPGKVSLMEGDSEGRRASPLLVHIQGLANGKACVVTTYLPAKLIPDGKHILISDGRNPPLHQPIPLALPDDFSALERFMDRLAKKGHEVRP